MAVSNRGNFGKLGECSPDSINGNIIKEISFGINVDFTMSFYLWTSPIPIVIENGKFVIDGVEMSLKRRNLSVMDCVVDPLNGMSDEQLYDHLMSCSNR